MLEFNHSPASAHSHVKPTAEGLFKAIRKFNGTNLDEVLAHLHPSTINARSTGVKKKRQITPLIFAVMNYLYMNGASHSQNDFDKRYRQLLDTLITAGADIHATDIYGRTAMFEAVVSGNRIAQQLLLQKGAYPYCPPALRTCCMEDSYLDMHLDHQNRDIAYYPEVRDLLIAKGLPRDLAIQIVYFMDTRRYPYYEVKDFFDLTKSEILKKARYDVPGPKAVTFMAPNAASAQQSNPVPTGAQADVKITYKVQYLAKL